jgi:uncharacterized protein
MDHTFLTETELDRLDSLLAPLAEQGDTMRLDEVQGFFCAIVSGPDQLATEDWLTDVLGEQGEFASPEERSEAIALLERFFADIGAALAAGEMPELILYSDEEGGEPDYWPWCNAYLYALDVVSTDWFEEADDEDFEDLLYPVMALGGMYDEEDDEPLVNFTAEEIVNLKEELPDALLAVYNYWRAKTNAPVTVRKDATPGRNDPCPCGSGKKYKQCCGKS